MHLKGEKLNEILGAIRDAEDVAPLRHHVMRALALLGAGKAYFVAPLTRDARVGRVLTNMGFPRVWERHYRARLSSIDPLPKQSLNHANAFVWPDNVDPSVLLDMERRYMALVAQYGQDRMIGTACYGPQGRAGFLGVGWAQEERPTQDVLLAVHQIGQVSFQSYCQIVRGDEVIPALSNRELEVLGWICRGKSNPDIAARLGISRSSVDAYIRRIFSKLEVTDRTAASVKAYSLGLITSDEVADLVARARRRADAQE
ncbi:MAG: LuxR C-terminal-related transcriptional regulator [Alteraurantiacibacter sp.]